MYKAPTYHKIKVENLENSTFKGEFFEVTIKKVQTNERFECIQDCSQGERCNLKAHVMNTPVKDHLICTIVVVSMKNISSRMLRFRTGRPTGAATSYCHIIDSNDEFYKTTKGDGDCQYACWYRITKKKYSHTHVESENIPPDARATFLLFFPEVPEEASIERLVIAGTSKTDWFGDAEYLEAFDFEKSEEPGSKTFTQ